MGARYVLRSCCEFNDVVDAEFDARGVDCETIYAAIVMIGCWPWSLAASVFSEILDRERGRHCHTPGESGILAGSKPEDRERKAVFGCCRRTRPRGDVVSVAGRRPSCGQEPVRSGPQLELEG